MCVCVCVYIYIYIYIYIYKTLIYLFFKSLSKNCSYYYLLSLLTSRYRLFAVLDLPKCSPIEVVNRFIIA